MCVKIAARYVVAPVDDVEIYEGMFPRECNLLTEGVESGWWLFVQSGPIPFEVEHFSCWIEEVEV